LGFNSGCLKHPCYACVHSYKLWRGRCPRPCANSLSESALFLHNVDDAARTRRTLMHGNAQQTTPQVIKIEGMGVDSYVMLVSTPFVTRRLVLGFLWVISFFPACTQFAYKYVCSAGRHTKAVDLLGNGLPAFGRLVPAGSGMDSSLFFPARKHVGALWWSFEGSVADNIKCGAQATTRPRAVTFPS
jgi:hypothetical protein